MHFNFILYCILGKYIFKNLNSVNCTETETVKSMHWEAVSDMPGYLDTTANRCTSESRVPTQWIPAPHGTPHTGGSPLSVCDLYCIPHRVSPTGLL